MAVRAELMELLSRFNTISNSQTTRSPLLSIIPPTSMKNCILEIRPTHTKLHTKLTLVQSHATSQLFWVSAFRIYRSLKIDFSKGTLRSKCQLEKTSRIRTKSALASMVVKIWENGTFIIIWWEETLKKFKFTTK